MVLSILKKPSKFDKNPEDFTPANSAIGSERILSAIGAQLQIDLQSLLKNIRLDNRNLPNSDSSNDEGTVPLANLYKLLNGAVRNGKIDVVNYILSLYKPQDPNDKSITEAHVHFNGQISNESIKILIENGFVINSKYKNDSFFIYLIIRNGHLALIEELMKCDFDLNEVNQCTGLTLLHIAQLFQNEEIIDFLIEHGANEEYKSIETEWCETKKMKPLRLAVINDDVVLVKLLLENEKDTYEDSDLISYIAAARQKLNSKTLEILLDYLSDVDCLDQYGESLLQICALTDYEFYYRDVKQLMSKVLLNKGADVNITNKMSKSVFIDAVRSGNVLLVEALLKNHVCVNQVTVHKNTALHLACYRNDWEMVKVLLEYNAAVDPKNIYGLTPLFIACRNKCKRIVETLLQYDADPFIRDEENSTLLHVLCKNLRDRYHSGVLKIFQQLLKKGLCVDAVNSNGVTPFIMICEADNVPMTNVIFEQKFAALLED